MAEAPGDIFGPIAGTLTGFTSVVNSGGLLFEVSPSVILHDTNVLQIIFDGSTTTGTYGRVVFTPQDVEYFRFYIKISAGFDYSDDYNMMPFFRLTDGGTYVADFGVYSVANTVPERWAIDYRYTTASNATNFTLDEWHMITVKYIRDASVGGIMMYVDGDLVLSDIDNNSSAYYVDDIRIGYAGVDVPANGDYFYFNDLIASTTDPGPYADAGGGIVNLLSGKLYGLLRGKL